MISILYVDDELQLLEMAKDYLERSGEFSVSTATSVKGAIEMLGSNRYDAILSDYELAGPTGIDLLRHIRKTDDRIPFLLFTGRGREEVVIEALNCGADFYLEKGTDLVTQFLQIEHEIREAVRRREAEEAQKRMEAMLLITSAAVRSAQNPLLITDLEGNLILVNPAYLNTFSYTDDREVLGMPVTDFFASPEEAGTVVDALLRDKAWSGEVVARKKGGDTFDARVIANGIRSDSGEIIGYVASCTDLTEQKQAYSQLESYIRLLKMVSTMAADLAECPPGGNIFDRIAGCLAALVPEGALVLTSSVHEEKGVFRVEAVRGAEYSLPGIEAFLGVPLVGLVLPATPEYLEVLRQGVFGILSGGVSELTFGQMTPDRCQALEHLLPGGAIWGAGFAWKGQVKGVTAILLPPDATIEYPDILTLMIRHAAAVLQRHEAEAALAGR